MKKRSSILILAISLIFIGCFSFMNYNYDPLSRYPYKNEEYRKLIKQYLNEDEIEYIIEYSIAPSLFIDFIKEKNFNIYHAEEYYELGKLQWDEPSSKIVTMVEETIDYMSVETLNNYLVHYSYSEIHYWLTHKDEYNQESNLVVNAGDMSAYLDDNYSITIRTPFNLQKLDDEIPTINDEDILVDIAIQEPLRKLCVAIKEETFLDQECGGLKVENGYISYQQQKTLYYDAVSIYGSNASYYEFYPGHSEHQLGLAIDFSIDLVDRENFGRSQQAYWLQENAYKYGFIQTYSFEKAKLYNKKTLPNHYRFVGVELAKYLYDNNISLKEALNK